MNLDQLTTLLGAFQEELDYAVRTIPLPRAKRSFDRLNALAADMRTEISRAAESQTEGPSDPGSGAAILPPEIP